LIKELKDLYEPFFLRRVKKEIFKIRSFEVYGSISGDALFLPLKTDFVVWVSLNPL
jgi:hypothetical protein